MSDIELIDRFVAGDRLCFNSLVWKWEKPIYNFVFRYLGKKEMARDITQ